MSAHDFERVTHFPVKLWDVVDDETSDVFKWSKDGSSFFVDDEKYEKEIMDRYPGFVQISSFANLRRLLREYSFSWNNNDAGEFQFSHPAFDRKNRDAVMNILTKRKSIQAASGQHPKGRRRLSADAKGTKLPKKAWVQPTGDGSVKLRMETLMRFPDKFWAVVNDTNNLLYWGEDGCSVIVDDKKYEDEIMARYPGFVQTNSFANLRRLLREYGFTWSIRDNGFFEFTHPNMRRNRQDLLNGVKTKRKAFKAGAHHPYLQYYRMEGDMNRFPDQLDPYERSSLLHHNMSPEVNHQQGVNQACDHVSSRGPHYRRDVHGTGDHQILHPSVYHGLHEPAAYRFMPQNGPLPWHGMPSSGSGDKPDPFCFNYPLWRQHSWGDNMLFPRRGGDDLNLNDCTSPPMSTSGPVRNDGSSHSVYPVKCKISASSTANPHSHNELEQDMHKPLCKPGLGMETPSNSFSLSSSSAFTNMSRPTRDPTIYQGAESYQSDGCNSRSKQDSLNLKHDVTEPHSYETVSPVGSAHDSNMTSSPSTDHPSLTTLEAVDSNNNNHGDIKPKVQMLSKLLSHEPQGDNVANGNDNIIDVDLKPCPDFYKTVIDQP